MAAFQKTNFGCCSAVGAATLKIGFKMRIAADIALETIYI